MHYPKINIELEFSSKRIDLIDSEFDLAFRMGKLEDTGYVARPIMKIPMCTIASPAYLKQNGTLRNPKDLLNHNCITGSINK